MTTYWLLPVDRPRIGMGRPLRDWEIDPRDEMLCGQCGALLAVDHQLWDPHGGALPATGGSVPCPLCGTINDCSWVVTERPR